MYDGKEMHTERILFNEDTTSITNKKSPPENRGLSNECLPYKIF
jgi:hypothetical protein